MTVHIIKVVEPGTLCGAIGDSIGLRFIVQHSWRVQLLMWLFGCRDCGAELREVMKTARPIR